MDYEEKTNIMKKKSYSKRKKKRNKKYIILFNKKTIIITIILILFFCFIFYIFFLRKRIRRQKVKLDNNYNNDTYKIEEKENNVEVRKIKNTDLFNLSKKIIEFDKSLRKITNEEIINFRKSNSENILFDNKKYQKSENPNITVIITMNNQAHCIHKALRSVQNQSLKNIEILILIDCSYDNSTETIQNYMKEDERIVMIDHNTIEGTMKIRKEGIMLAKGNYITFLDGDDAFMHKDVLNNSIFIADLGNLDIVEFYGSEYRNRTTMGYTHFHIESVGVISQPKLRTQFINLKEKNNEYYRPIRCRNIWGKVIKKEIFLKTLDYMGSKYYDDYILEYEDTMMRIALFNVANTYYLIKSQPGYFYSRDEKEGIFPFLRNKKCQKRQNVLKNIDGIKFLQFLFEKFQDNEFEQKTIYYELITIKFYEFKRYFMHPNQHYEMFYDILDKVYKIKYLTVNEKKNVLKIIDEVKKIEEESKNKKNKDI